MVSRNWEDWAFGVSLAAAAALGLTLHEVRAPSFAAEAVAAEQTRADYVMTITAHRLPAECKGVSQPAMPASCAALLDSATISMRQNR